MLSTEADCKRMFSIIRKKICNGRGWLGVERVFSILQLISQGEMIDTIRT
jgi:hypothetical protein